ncbi:MAG: hypothetical protein ACR2HN_14125 [Tepidiformaceae bacterium]
MSSAREVTVATNGGRPGATMEQLLERDAGAVLEVLEDFGIRLDPWTLIAVKCTPEELAEYSAILRPAELREALERRLGLGAGRR